MAGPALNPDAIAQAFIDLLKPGGVPVGNVGDFVKRTPDVPYQGATPIVQVKPSQNINSPGQPVSVAGARFDDGFMDLIYRDAPPSQQIGRTESQIEDAMWTARNAIVAALVARPATLGGAVVNAAYTIEEAYNPDGPFAQWQGAEWLGFVMRVSYRGPKQTI